MALTTYAGLKSAIASWMHRSDLTTQIPDFVALAEADISRDVRVQAMESLATGTLTGETLDFPDRFLSSRRLTLDGEVCEYRVPTEYEELKDAGSTANVYTVIGQKFYILQGSSGAAYSLLYVAMFAGLSGDSDTNWLLVNHPNVYLFGALKHAHTWVQDDPSMARAAAMYQTAVAAANMSDIASKYAGRLNIRVR